MDQIVDKTSLGKMAGLQKGYIDQGDQRNAEAIAANSEKLDNMLLGAGYAVAEYTRGSTDYRPKYEAGIGKGILDYFCPVYITSTELDNAKREVKATKLQGNSFFRNSKGNYIPTVYVDVNEITEAMINGSAQGDILESWNYRIMCALEGGLASGKYGYIPFEECFDPEQNNTLREDIIIHIGNPSKPPTATEFTQLSKGEPLNKENYLGFKAGSISKEDFIKIYINGEYVDSDGTVYRLIPRGFAYINRETTSYQEPTDTGWTPALGEDGTEFIALGGILPLTILLPWETLLNIPMMLGVANTQPLYLCDNQVGASGRYWKGLFFNPRWDGLDLSKWILPPTAIGCQPMATIEDTLFNGNTCSINQFRVSKGMNNCQGNKGLLPYNPFFDDLRTYPRVNDVNQVNNMKWARANNGNSSLSPYPFAEGGHFAHNVFITALELAAGTKYIHAANLFGSGISSNDGCNANNFFTSGGVRFRVKDTGDGTPGNWQYKTFGANCSPLQYNASGATTDMSNLLTQYYPKEQCMESQMAASMATELGVAPAIEPNEENIEQFLFKFYGRNYYYMNVPGFDGLQEGKMNCRVYKYMRHDVQAWMDGKETVFEMEVIYRMSLFMGVNLTGDIWAYYGGGLEMIGTPKAGATAGSTGNQIELYVEPDQTKWHSETAITKPAGQRFDFEDTYKLLATVNNLGDSYTLTREGYTPFKVAKASSMAQGECYYQWDNAHWISGTNRVRVKSLFRSGSSDAYCAPRYLDATHAASTTNRYFSGSAQALVEFE